MNFFPFEKMQLLALIIELETSIIVNELFNHRYICYFIKFGFYF
jgi:hypothetical protein